VSGDAVALCARGESVWHRLGLSALGVEWHERGGVAWREQAAARVYLGALTLSREATAAQVAAVVEGLPGDVSVRDSFGSLELGPFGWRLADRTPWMLRPPSSVPALPEVAGLRIAPVKTAAEVVVFEHTAAVAASGDPAWADTGSIHASPQSIDVPGLTLLLATLDGAPVGTALAAVGDGQVQVSAVGVMPSVRRRGIASALTVAALSLAPELPATLGSSEAGHGVYLRLGFRDAGISRRWERA
jgi:GNAT superfamily N-acetyltransferase